MSLHLTVQKRHFFSAHLLFLFAVALFIRLPFFFRDYIDRDESTFILVGQGVADGYLPYDVLWDLKPPLLFYLFGLIEYIFPHSLLAIRIFGLLIVFFSAVFLDRIAKEAGLKNGFWMALGYILLSSMFGSLQGVMSEHLSVFFLLPGLLYFIKDKTPVNGLISGFALGCAVLCKLNYAYAVLALFLCYFLINYRKEGLSTVFKHLVFPALGVTACFLLVAIPYMAQGKFILLINSALKAPMEYGHARTITWLGKLEATWWMILASLVIIYFCVKKTGKGNRQIAWLCSALLLGTVYTFFSSGTINGHYLIQVFPMLLILFLGILIAREFKPRLLLLTLFLLAISYESLSEYYRLVYNYGQYGSLYNGKVFRTVDVLKKKELTGKKIFFTSYHLGYWLINKYPLTKTSTHPSNLNRPYLFRYMDSPRKTSMEELQYIMEELRPDVIVSGDQHLQFFNIDSEENIYFREKIIQDYHLIFEGPNKKIVIWERKGS